MNGMKSKKRKPKKEVAPEVQEASPSAQDVANFLTGGATQPVTGSLIAVPGQELMAVSQQMSVNADVRIDIDSLVRMPMRAFKDECEKNIRELSLKYASLKEEADKTESEINVTLMSNDNIRKGIAPDEIADFKKAFKAIGCECKQDSMAHAIEVEKAKIKYTIVLKYEDKKPKNAYYNSHEITFERIITAADAGLAEQFTKLQNLRAAVIRVEAMATEWRRKYGTIHDVDDRLRCALTENQVKQFEGGAAMIAALQAIVLDQLKDLPRLTN